MKALGDLLERNIKLVGADALSQRGFVQVPVAILRNKQLSIGAKMAYTALLSYAWHNDFCFPGQDRMADDIGAGRTSVNSYIKELEKKGFIKITRRGQGRTNLYEVNFRAKGLQNAKR
jgi:biotin operon repressor